MKKIMILKQDNIKASQGVSREVKACQGKSRRVRSSKFLGGIWVLMALMLMGLTGCINDVPFYKEEPEIKGDVVDYYITLTLTLPTQTYDTRSSTTADGESSSGYLEGSVNEVQLKQATLYFYDLSSYKVLLVVNEDPIIQTREALVDKQFGLTYRVTLEDLKKVLGKRVGLVVVGNEGSVYSGITHSLEEGADVFTAKFSISSPMQRPIGDFGNDNKGQIMPLVNANEFTVDFSEIPASGTDQEISKNIKEKLNFSNNTIFLTPQLEMERAVARIDWKDTDRSQMEIKDPNIYQIGKTALYIELYSLQEFNINKQSYLFKHTAKGTTKGANSEQKLFGKERKIPDGTKTDENSDDSDDEEESLYNWVAGADWGSLTNSSYNKGGTFLNSSIIDPEKSIITGVNGNTGSIKISELSDRTTQDGYYPWIYISENTLPSISTDLTAKASGIAFTFKIKNGTDDLTLEDVNTGTNLPSNISKASNEEDETGKAIRITDEEGSYVIVPYTEVKGENEEILLDESGYFLTYYGFIVHNNDEAYKDVMAPMYHGVVRNNVYQVSVKSISGLPHPNEPESQFLSLQIKVLAWAKRDINVKF